MVIKMTKNSIDVAFIILHYKNIDDTLECIESIKKINTKNYKIIAIDNNSGSEKDLKKLKKVVDDLIINNKNIGFAKGNNKGIDLAKEKYNPKYIAVINNDTIIQQPDLIERVDDIYKETKFDALGFNILTNNGDSVNPFPSYKTLEQVNKAIKKSKKLIKIYKSPLKRTLLKIYLKIKYTFIKIKHPNNAQERLEDVSLHGCAIIFSNKYLKKYKYAFYNETFLYHEEEFLEYRRSKDNLKFVYDPNIIIFHKEGSSLNFNYSNDLYKKMIFRETNIIKSLTMLKNIMEENKEI